MIYIIGWIFLYSNLSSSSLKKKTALQILSIIFVGSIAVFRGNVGVDTPVYEYIAETISFQEIEPLFKGLLYILSSIFSSSVIVIRIVAFLQVVIMLVYYYNSDFDEKFILFSFILPVFFYPYSMNMIRLGLASVFLLLCAQSLRHGEKNKFIIFGILATMFHHTVIVSVVILWLITQNLRQIKWIILISTIFLVILYYIGGMNYFLVRKETYIDFKSPGALSGLVYVISIIFLTFFLFFSSKINVMLRIKLVVIIFSVTAVSWLLAKQSYAGLRFLDLILFVTPLSVLVIYGQEKISFDRSARICFIISGILCVINQFRIFWISKDIGNAPMIPYTIFFSV